jgi:hypothetical protein
MSNNGKEIINSAEERIPPTSNGRRVGGFILGIMFGGLLMLAYYLGASPSEFFAANKLTLILILIGCGIFGAIIGEKAMEKVAAWLSWFG